MIKLSLLISLVAATLTWVIPSTVFAREATVSIKLSPAGGFVGKTPDVKGFVKKVGSKFMGENIIVNLKNLKTGMGLRDEHTQKYLQTAEFPEAVLVKAEGENGKGTGLIKIKGIEKPITGTYTLKGKDFLATFPLTLSDFKIDKIRYMGVGVKDQVTVTVNIPVQ